MSKVVRTVKNVTKGYSAVQIKVRNATSNDPWGPTGQEMTEIAQMTFNGSNDFYEIMDMLDKRLNDKGKNWRHVLKSLKVLDYCLHEGSELVVTWARKNIYIIKTLREFQYMEDETRDVGQNVRISAKELTALIMDEERLRAERADRKSWKSRVTGINDYGEGYGEPSHSPPRRTNRRTENDDDNDLEMRLALEASRNEMEEDKKRRQSREPGGDDEDLAKAIRLSQEEEELRRRELEEQNAQSLFDDTPTPVQTQQPQFTGWNQGYQQGGAVDLFGNPVYQQQQPQTTGFLDNAYAQNYPQQTGFQDGFQNQGFDPFGQPQNPYLQPQQTIQPQQTAFNVGNNPYAQNNDFNAFQQQQQQQPQEPPPAAGSQNPWASNPLSQDSMKPLATGSNNPFASKPVQPPPRAASQPTLSSLAEQRTATQFNNRSNNNPILNFQAPQPQPQPQPHAIQPPQQPFQQHNKPMNPQHERLNQLLASGEGMDTFGNTGELRIPAQHTAPGTFVNSAGQNLNRLHAAQTGNNPFFSNQQGRMPPAQTGPGGQLGGFGQGGNPFGGQQQSSNQGGSLIDL